MKKIGIDIGGMSIKAGIVDENANIICTHSIPTQVESGFENIVKNMIKMIYDLIENASLKLNDIDNIGIGIPGVADSNGKVHYATNLLWTNVELGKLLKTEFKNINVAIENDATVACVAEHSFGSIQGVQNAIMLTLGTGVGGGIIINGQKYSGNLGLGSEIGHMIVGENFYDCNCESNGCLETFCSATAIIKYAQKLLKESEYNSVLTDINFEDITAKMVFDGYKNNDELCIKVIKRFLKYLSIGISNLINLFAPEYIVLGGGVAGSYDLYIDELYELVHKNIIFKNLPFAKIVKATLGNDAGIVGAAMLK